MFSITVPQFDQWGDRSSASPERELKVLASGCAGRVRREEQPKHKLAATTTAKNRRLRPTPHFELALFCFGRVCLRLCLLTVVSAYGCVCLRL